MHEAAIAVLTTVFAPVNVFFYIMLGLIMGYLFAANHLHSVKEALMVSLPFTFFGIFLTFLYGGVTSESVLWSIIGRATLFIGYCCVVWISSTLVKKRFPMGA